MAYNIIKGNVLSGGTKIVTNSYTITSDDHIILVGILSSPITITLPASPAGGNTYIIKDQNGSALINNITISGNGHNIDGSSSVAIVTNYGSVIVIYGNSRWGRVSLI